MKTNVFYYLILFIYLYKYLIAEIEMTNSI